MLGESIGGILNTLWATDELAATEWDAALAALAPLTVTVIAVALSGGEEGISRFDSALPALNNRGAWLALRLCCCAAPSSI